MSDDATRLTDAVNAFASRFDTFSGTLTTEMAEIAAALRNTGDLDLRQAANDAAARLDSLGTRLDAMNTDVQGIIR